MDYRKGENADLMQQSVHPKGLKQNIRHFFWWL